MEQENRFVFWTTIIANISVAVGVIFAGYQFWETRQFEKMQNSMELINKLKGRDVVSAYKKILEHKESKNKKPDDIVNELNYIASNYEYASIVYASGNVDKQFVEKNIHVNKIVELLKFYNYPESGMSNILALQKEENEK